MAIFGIAVTIVKTVSQILTQRTKTRARKGKETVKTKRATLQGEAYRGIIQFFLILPFFIIKEDLGYKNGFLGSNNITAFILVAGYYNFNAYLMTENQSPDSIFGYIMRDETTLCRLHANDADVKYTTGFCEVNVELAAGDEIYVRGRGFFNGGYSGFNGMFTSVLE